MIRGDMKKIFLAGLAVAMMVLANIGVSQATPIPIAAGEY